MDKNSFDVKKVEKIYEETFKNEKEKFDHLIDNMELIISLFGSVSAGKSKTVNVLTGKKLATVKSIAGCTKEISKYVFRNNIIIADTPGLSDINEEVSNRAEEFVEKNSDIILFFLNAAVGITSLEKKALIRIKNLGKPILVVMNKIDVLESDEDETKQEKLFGIIKQVKDETGFEVIPISATKKINIEKLNEEILNILENNGKDILYLKISQFKKDIALKWIRGATLSAVGIGAIPIPGSDIIPLTSLQIGLALRLAYIWNCEITKNDIMPLIATTVTGTVGKQIFKLAVSALKSTGWIPGGQLVGIVAVTIASTIAGAVTYSFGLACNEYYKSGMTMDLSEFEYIFKTTYDEYKNNKN